ncbi:hypothetical protein [Aurantiacibacter aquimixticola]|uniref:hypothetical protein n=1 Tax=Aurantiacibacter aquimixticola TaxID=1958945 RepID=UPI0014027EAF|nr:hypothetical protein [Aurantiacibacter aquimixticola]
MSKQLAISASASIFAMAAFALLTPQVPVAVSSATNEQSATMEIAAPAFDVALPDWISE